MATTYSIGSRQFIRKVGLVVSDFARVSGPLAIDGDPDATKEDPNVSSLGVSTTALDLSDFRIRFEVHSSDQESPNTAVIRVYNLKPETATKVMAEYQRVSLQAGYEHGNYAIIFQGTIKQFKRGKENNVDSYLEIRAAEGDEAYNFGLINVSIAAGSTPVKRAAVVANAMGVPLDPNSEAAISRTGGILPRGRVQFGLARAMARTIANSAGARWSIQDGKMVYIPLDGFVPGKYVTLNSTSGLIGIPEATDNGISVQMLLNPLLRIGTGLQIANDDITQTQINEQYFANYGGAPDYAADVTNDGLYRVLSIDHFGDTRGQEWYSSVICLNIDQSSAGEGQPSVLPYG